MVSGMGSLTLSEQRSVDCRSGTRHRQNTWCRRIGGLIGKIDIPGFANGGIVTGPTLAMVGEKGPEAIVPLNKAGGFGGVTINVNGGISTSAQIGQAVYNSLLNYKQVYGPLNALAS
jgi:hypothetical protein